MKTTLRIVVSLVLSALFLWVAFRHVDFPQMWQYMRGADHRYTLIFVGSVIVMHLVRIFRWDILIRPFAQVSKLQILRISALGLMLIVVLPLRLGEFARPYLLKREVGAPLSSGLGAVVVERIVDGMLVSLLFFLTTVGLGSEYQVPWGLRLAGVAALGLFSGVLVAVLIAMFAHRFLECAKCDQF